MTQQPRRVRDLGIVVGALPTGPLNAITDVPGVRVGHTTITDGTEVHTGVTAIVPDQLSPVRRTLPAAVYVGNGHGKIVGATQLDELGTLETPVLLTATLSVFRAADALLTHLLDRDPAAITLNPVVGETNDGYLSDIRRRPVTERHVLDALHGATPDLPGEGCVGAGTGTAALGFKAGIGTASRQVEVDGAAYTVGTLVQANFGGTLTVRGVPMPAAELLGDPPTTGTEPVEPAEPVGNSCMIVVATDVPLDSRRLGRVARRAVFAMGRVGADFGGSSGDYAIAFGTAGPDRAPVPDERLDPVFAAVMDAVEEALLNSLFMATTTRGLRGTRYAVPHDAALARLRAAGLLPGTA